MYLVCTYGWHRLQVTVGKGIGTVSLLGLQSRLAPNYLEFMWRVPNTGLQS